MFIKEFFTGLDAKSVAVGAVGTGLVFGAVIGGIKLRNKLKGASDDDLDDIEEEEQEEQEEEKTEKSA